MSVLTLCLPYLIFFFPGILLVLREWKSLPSVAPPLSKFTSHYAPPLLLIYHPLQSPARSWDAPRFFLPRALFLWPHCLECFPISSPPVPSFGSSSLLGEIHSGACPPASSRGQFLLCIHSVRITFCTYLIHSNFQKKKKNQSFQWDWNDNTGGNSQNYMFSMSFLITQTRCFLKFHFFTLLLNPHVYLSQKKINSYSNLHCEPLYQAF